MNKRRAGLDGGVGAFSVIRERPLLFIVLAVTVFAGALLAARELIEPPSIDARLRTEIIDLDGEAEDAGSLIKPAPLDAERLKNAILNQDTQDAAGRDRLTILKGDQNGEFIIGLGGDDTPDAIDVFTGQIQAFADQQNQRRAEQNAEAASWIERQRTGWQTRIDEAKTAIVRSPFNPDLLRAARGSESAKLLQLMIDATTEGQKKQPTNQLDVATRLEAAINNGSEDGSGLAADTARLTNALKEIESGYAAQHHHGTALKEAESGLAELLEEAEELMREGGVLDRAAVTVLMPAFDQPANPPQHLWAAGWRIILPGTAAASLILALIGTWLACRLWPPIEVALNDHLNDPHWPLPPNVQRDLST